MLEDMTNREPEAPENAPAEPAAEEQPADAKEYSVTKETSFRSS